MSKYEWLLQVFKYVDQNLNGMDSDGSTYTPLLHALPHSVLNTLNEQAAELAGAELDLFVSGQDENNVERQYVIEMCGLQDLDRFLRCLRSGSIWHPWVQNFELTNV